MSDLAPYEYTAVHFHVIQNETGPTMYEGDYLSEGLPASHVGTMLQIFDALQSEEWEFCSSDTKKQLPDSGIAIFRRQQKEASSNGYF